MQYAAFSGLIIPVHFAPRTPIPQDAPEMDEKAQSRRIYSGIWVAVGIQIGPGMKVDYGRCILTLLEERVLIGESMREDPFAKVKRTDGEAEAVE